jgi:hypothetical protein
MHDTLAPFMDLIKKQSKKRHFTDSDDESDQEVTALEETPLDWEEI